MTNMIIQAYAEASAAFDTAEQALRQAAADYIDAHSEIDTTGEWQRIRELFPHDYAQHWYFEGGEAVASFHKTTNRGLYEHDIKVPHADLETWLNNDKGE